MRVLVCGSRDWQGEDAIRRRIDALPAATTVIVGGAPGADWWAELRAELRGLPVEVFKADWRRYGKKAGPIRNLQMLDQDPDLVIAFQRKRSRGTQHTIDEARRRGIPVEVIAA